MGDGGGAVASGGRLGIVVDKEVARCGASRLGTAVDEEVAGSGRLHILHRRATPPPASRADLVTTMMRGAVVADLVAGAAATDLVADATTAGASGARVWVFFFLEILLFLVIFYFCMQSIYAPACMRVHHRHGKKCYLHRPFGANGWLNHIWRNRFWPYGKMVFVAVEAII